MTCSFTQFLLTFSFDHMKSKKKLQEDSYRTAENFLESNPDSNYEEDLELLAKAVEQYVDQSNWFTEKANESSLLEIRKHQGLFERAALKIEELTSCAAHAVCHCLL